jgi:two-component system, OmpR family, response regulator
MRILLVDDDIRLTRLIATALTDEGYSVDTADDGDSGLELALRGAYEVAIFDWMLPGRDGPSLCRAVRANKLPVAILLLTARTQVEDQVAGLDSGADDYLAKPFSFDILLARVRALGRRFEPSADSWELRRGNVVLDLRAHTARRNEQALDLSATEWKLLEFFMRHPGQALTRQQILDYAWSYDCTVQETMVDVYVSYLRKKINQPNRRDPISTVRGVGYRWEDDRA